MKNIAIIPARSGSKGLKDKNIKLLNGKPLLAYSIEAAIKSKCFDVVFVSTDSKKYANIAKQYGAEASFLRSKKNSNDKSNAWDVIREVLDNYKKLGKEFDTFMYLQPTSPLRTSNDIKKSYKLYKELKANSIVSICEAEVSPLYCYQLPKNKLLSKILNVKNENKRRQDAGTFFTMNGAIYLANVNNFLKTNDIYKNKCYAYVMNKKSSIDIDDELDFKYAETILKK